MIQSVLKTYGDKIRPRATGVCIKDDRLLLINHKKLYNRDFWAPPGGGIDFGETAEECLIHEFREETNLEINILRFLFIYEFIQPPLHAIELFFEVEHKGGALQLGDDPEIKRSDQIISEAKFVSFSDIHSMKPEKLHGVFQLVNKPAEIVDLRGYLKP